MQKVNLDKSYFEGAVSVEPGAGWFKPWRIAWEKRDLFIAPGDSLVKLAAHASGCRLRFETDTTKVGLECLPMPAINTNPAHVLDLTIDGNLITSASVPEGGTTAFFEGLPEGTKIVEIWLPHDGPIELCGMTIDDGASCRVISDERPKWITYGSSLTHCTRAHGSGRTWPAIVARAKKLNLTSLGFGGNCCLDPMIAMTIRDLPANLITLKLGINCIGGALAPRTFPGAVMGLVQIIREKQPDTPIALISPFSYPPHETKPNLLNYTIQGMRKDIAEVHSRLKAWGDENLYYFNGMNLFTLEENARYTQDQCHANGDGIELQGEKFLDQIMSNLPIQP